MQSWRNSLLWKREFFQLRKKSCSLILFFQKTFTFLNSKIVFLKNGVVLKKVDLLKIQIEKAHSRIEFCYEEIFFHCFKCIIFVDVFGDIINDINSKLLK